MALTCVTSTKYLNNLLMPMQCSGFTVDSITFTSTVVYGVIPTRCDHVLLQNHQTLNMKGEWQGSWRWFNRHSRMPACVGETYHCHCGRWYLFYQDSSYTTDIADRWYGDPRTAWWCDFLMTAWDGAAVLRSNWDSVWSRPGRPAFCELHLL